MQNSFESIEDFTDFSLGVLTTFIPVTLLPTGYRAGTLMLDLSCHTRDFLHSFMTTRASVSPLKGLFIKLNSAGMLWDFVAQLKNPRRHLFAEILSFNTLTTPHQEKV